MHQLLENTLAKESADPAFEQRMLNRFRDKVPASEDGLISFLAGLMRMRAAQITAVAALLLTLVQVGKMVTGEGGKLRKAQVQIALAPPPPDEGRPGAVDQKTESRSNLPTAEGFAQQGKEEELSAASSFRSADELKKDLNDKLKPAAERARQEGDRPDDAGRARRQQGREPGRSCPGHSRRFAQTDPQRAARSPGRKLRSGGAAPHGPGGGGTRFCRDAKFRETA